MCEVCGDPQVVIAQYGIDLKELGLSSRFCSSHLCEFLTKKEANDMQ